MAEVNINFVELYTSVLDRQKRPVEGLEQKNFSVTEDGTKQEISRFERVTNLPIHAAVALDISASMDKSLDKARQAALEFFQRTIRPKDRAAVITFNDHPNLTVKFTNDVPTLAGGLAGLKAERGTALYDSIIFTLYYFTGIKGQRALLLLSDGKDEGSRFTFDDALDYARRAGVTIYAIGLGEDVDKRKLSRLSEETGGRAFFLKNAEELAGIYAGVEQELRSQYLIAYQSTNTSGGNVFRSVELKVDRPGLEAKTIRGYYP
jgi:Ca-activated chloride channel family protein